MQRLPTNMLELFGDFCGLGETFLVRPNLQVTLLGAWLCLSVDSPDDLLHRILDSPRLASVAPRPRKALNPSSWNPFAVAMGHVMSLARSRGTVPYSKVR